MKLSDVVRELRKAGCAQEREGGRHTVWRCPCGGHVAAVPRHRQISAGVVGSIAAQLSCLQKGWLQ